MRQRSSYFKDFEVKWSKTKQSQNFMQNKKWCTKIVQERSNNNNNNNSFVTKIVSQIMEIYFGQKYQHHHHPLCALKLILCILFLMFFCEAKQYDKHVYVYKQSIVKIILFNKLYYGKIFTKIFAKCVLHKSQHTMKTTNNENSNDKNMRLNWYACWLISLSKVKVKHESKQNKKPQNRRWKN